MGASGRTACASCRPTPSDWCCWGRCTGGSARRTTLDEAEWLVSEVERVLGRSRGIRIGEAPDRDGQYFHYLGMWLFALARLGALEADYRRRGIALPLTNYGVSLGLQSGAAPA